MKAAIYNLDYMHATDENENHIEDQDLDYDLIRYDVDVNGDGNDEHTINADKPMQNNVLPLGSLALAWEQKPSPG